MIEKPLGRVKGNGGVSLYLGFLVAKAQKVDYPGSSLGYMNGVEGEKTAKFGKRDHCRFQPAHILDDGVRLDCTSTVPRR
jgi:hypothetical protein